MADAGAIGIYTPLFHVRQTAAWAAGGAPAAALNRDLFHTRVMPQWGLDHRTLHTIPVDGYITGLTKELGVPVGERWVGLYYRSTLELIARVQSAPDGSFRFNDLESGVNKYYVIALPNDTSVTYDAVIADRVEAV